MKNDRRETVRMVPNVMIATEGKTRRTARVKRYAFLKENMSVGMRLVHSIK